MALFACHECGKQISTEAKVCPNCGAKARPPKSKTRWSVILSAIAFVFIASAIMRGGQSPSQTATVVASPPATTRSAPSPRDAQLQKAVLGAKVLRSALNDPDSFDLSTLLLMDDGTACYEFRAKNGFGAKMIGYAVQTTDGKMLVKEQDGSRFTAVWNKQCTKRGEDIADGVKPWITR